MSLALLSARDPGHMSPRHNTAVGQSNKFITFILILMSWFRSWGDLPRSMFPSPVPKAPRGAWGTSLWATSHSPLPECSRSVHRRLERLRLRRGGRVGRRGDLSVRRMRHASSVGPRTRLRGPISRTRRSPTHEPTRTKLLPLTPTNAIERAESSTAYTMAISSSSPSQVGGRGSVAPSVAPAELAFALSPEPKATATPTAKPCRIRFHFGTGRFT